MKIDQNWGPTRPETALKSKPPVPVSLDRRVDFAERVENALISSDSLPDEEILAAFEKTRSELASELDEKEKRSLWRTKKTEAGIELWTRKIVEWEKEQSEMTPENDVELWDLLDWDSEHSQKFEALNEKINTACAILETLKKKKASFVRKGEWRVKACLALEKASEKLRRKYAQIRDYETHWTMALPEGLRNILENNVYKTIRTGLSVTFVLKTTNGIDEQNLWSHYRDTPFSWVACHSKRSGWTKETLRHEARHNAYEALFEESRFDIEFTALHSHLRSLENLSRPWIPESIRKRRHSHLIRSIRAMAKVFAEKFLSHNRDEVIANFEPLLSFQSSTETLNADDIHENLKTMVEALKEGTQAKSEAKKLLERYEVEIEAYFDRLSDFLFVARLGNQTQTAKMLLYVTEPYEFELAEAHLETLVSAEAYDSFSKLRRLLHPEGIRHSVPRRSRSEIRDRDYSSLIRYFTMAEKDNAERPFKNHPTLVRFAGKLERKYLDKNGKAINVLTPEEKLLRIVFWQRLDDVRKEGLELARLIRAYVGENSNA